MYFFGNRRLDSSKEVTLFFVNLVTSWLLKSGGGSSLVAGFESWFICDCPVVLSKGYNFLLTSYFYKLPRTTIFLISSS